MLCFTRDRWHAPAFIAGKKKLKPKQNNLHCRTNYKSWGQSFILGSMTCWSLVLVNTLRPATHVPWDGTVAVTKENSLKVWWCLSHLGRENRKRYTGAVACFCNVMTRNLMWSKLTLLFGKKASTRATLGRSNFSQTFPFYLSVNLGW